MFSIECFSIFFSFFCLNNSIDPLNNMILHIFHLITENSLKSNNQFVNKNRKSFCTYMHSIERQRDEFGPFCFQSHLYSCQAHGT